MLFKFKIIEAEKDSKILGMFGDCIKVRIKIQNTLQADFISFIAKELGIPESMVVIISKNIHKNRYELELPDLSYEILMSWLENK